MSLRSFLKLVPVLAGATIGLIPMVTRRRDRGMVWLRVFLVLMFIGYSVVAAKFERYALPMMLFVDILAAVGIVASWQWLARRGSGPSPHDPADAAQPIAPRPAWLRLGIPLTIGAATVGVMTVAQLRAMPFFSTFQNPIGASLAPPATIFRSDGVERG